MLAPILLVLFGICIPKSKLLCCLHKYANKMVSQIEYQTDEEKQPGGDVIEGELELKENIKM